MAQKNKFHALHIYIFIILAGTGFTSCRHKHKASDNSIINNEMPLPTIDNNVYYPPAHQMVIVSDNDQTYDVVEQMPQFPGGEKELLYFISKYLKYPVIAQENGIQGKVVCRFVITKYGVVNRVEVIRSLDPACDKEAIRVIKSLPSFIPGKQNGVNVNVWYTLPINFKLE